MSIAIGVRLGELRATHRDALETIVRATKVFNEDEIAVALELFDETLSALGARLSALESRERKAGSREPDYEFVGAFEGEELIGYACFGATPATDRTYDLYWIAVHPGAQRSGAGAALMDAVEERLTRRGARLLVVETSSRADYEPTRRFYGKRGYDQAAQIPDFYAPGDHRVILTKTLSA